MSGPHVARRSDWRRRELAWYVSKRRALPVFAVRCAWHLRRCPIEPDGIGNFGCDDTLLPDTRNCRAHGDSLCITDACFVNCICRSGSKLVAESYVEKLIETFR